VFGNSNILPKAVFRRTKSPIKGPLVKGGGGQGTLVIKKKKKKTTDIDAKKKTKRGERKRKGKGSLVVNPCPPALGGRLA